MAAKLWAGLTWIDYYRQQVSYNYFEFDCISSNDACFYLQLAGD